MLEDGLYSYLSGQSGVTDLVGARIYPGRAPQDVALPYLVYSRVDTVPEGVMEGPAGLATTRLQFDCFAASLRAAKLLAAALRSALDGYSGTMGSTAVGSVLWLDELDVYEPQTLVDGVTADYQVMYQV